MTKSKGGRPRARRRPPSKLRAWMRANEQTVKGMASDLGIAASSVYALRERTLTPGLALAVRIERLTGIPVEYWTRRR